MTEKSTVIVTPVYEDMEACQKLFKEISKIDLINPILIVVDDGSTLKPLNSKILEDAGLLGVVIRLRRNVGHQLAIAIGLHYVSNNITCECNIVIMDSDGEDIPKSIPSILRMLEENNCDLVVAQRKKRVETLSFNLFYVLYKYIFKFLTGREIRFGNFMAMTKRSLDRLVIMPELSIHIAAAVLASKLCTIYCPQDRGPRYAGKSKMNFVGLALHGFKGLMVFAEDVLVRVGIACALIIVLTTICMVLAICLKIMGIATPGWFSIAMGILIVVALQSGALTLITLMLTGLVRSGSIATFTRYDGLVEMVFLTNTVDDEIK
jgi:hypothetical protein